MLEVLHHEGHVDEAPATVYAKCWTRGTYLARVPTMYRLLRASAEVRECRRQTTHPAAQKPDLVATAPNQCWSWDITKLLGAGEVELLLPLRSYRHLEPLRSGLDAGPDRAGQASRGPVGRLRASARGN